MGFWVGLHGSNPEPLMSALGQKQTSGYLRSMSALPPKADIGSARRDVRFVPKADSRAAANCRLFDHLIGERKQVRRDCEAKRLRGLEIDDQLKLCRRLHGEIGRLLTLDAKHSTPTFPDAQRAPSTQSY